MKFLPVWSWFSSLLILIFVFMRSHILTHSLCLKQLPELQLKRLLVIGFALLNCQWMLILCFHLIHESVADITWVFCCANQSFIVNRFDIFSLHFFKECCDCWNWNAKCHVPWRPAASYSCVIGFWIRIQPRKYVLHCIERKSVQGVYHILLCFASFCIVHVIPNDSVLLYYLVAVSIVEF